MRFQPLLLSLTLTACVTAESAQLPQPAVETPPLSAPPPQPPPPPVPTPATPPIHFDILSPAGYLEREAYRALGPEPVVQARGARTSIIVQWSVGRVWGPGPVTAFQVAVRTGQGWQVWQKDGFESAAPQVASRLDAILGDPKFWKEPERFPHSNCTDVGGVELLIRHQGRVRVSWVDDCHERALTRELGYLVHRTRKS
ncbi:MAG TPA: hypothetical protein VGB59_04270 [Allosphingosinicella sp.]|jgi:hypothetical protein